MAALWGRAKEALGLQDEEAAQPEGQLARLLNVVDEATTMDRSTVRKRGGACAGERARGAALSPLLPTPHPPLSPARGGAGALLHLWPPPPLPPPPSHPPHTQRLIGFAACLATGILFGALGSLFVLVSPRKFAALYTLSNILSLASTCFLVGPAKQARSMCAPARAPAAVAYLASLAWYLYARVTTSLDLGPYTW